MAAPSPPSRIWPSAVIFDLDGTLVDTAPDLTTVLNRTLSELGLPPHSLEAVREMVGGGLKMLLDRALAAHGVRLDDAAKAKSLARLVELYAADPAVLSRAYPGAGEMLRQLRERGVACGVCTNKHESISRNLLQALGIASDFACILGGETGFAKKPDPTGLKHLLRQIGVEPSDAVMVGDSRIDVETARGAGLAGAILVSYGYSGEAPEACGADFVIGSLAELPEALASLGARRGHDT